MTLTQDGGDGENNRVFVIFHTRTHQMTGFMDPTTGGGLPESAAFSAILVHSRNTAGLPADVSSDDECIAYMLAHLSTRETCIYRTPHWGFKCRLGGYPWPVLPVEVALLQE